MGITTVQVGLTRSVKDLKQIADNHEYVLDQSRYDIGAFTVSGTVIIRSADPAKPATLTFPSCWGNVAKGPDLGQPIREGTIHVKGSLTIKDVKTVGATGVDPQNIIVIGSEGNANIDLENIAMDGGGIARLGGANSVTLKNISSTGKPRAYFFACFDNQVNVIDWDNTGAGVIQQGGNIVDGSPQGETCIRLMHGKKVSIKGVIVKAWLYDDKHAWKQAIQDRAGGSKGIAAKGNKAQVETLDDGSVHEWINCQVIDGQPEIGWMQGKRDPKEVEFPLGLSQWTNCEFGLEPRVFPYCKRAEFIGCKVAGKSFAKTVTP